MPPADDLVGPLVGVGDVAGQLRQGVAALGGKGEVGRRVVAVLGLEFRVVDGMGRQPRDGAGLHPADVEALVLEPGGEPGRGGVAHPPGGKVLQADVDQAVEKGAGGDHHRPDPDLLVDRGAEADDAAVVDQQAVDRGLAERQVRLVLQHRLHPQAVEEAVGLGPGRADGRALAGVETAELDRGGVDVLRHLAAEGVDLPHQVALGQAADRRVAGHGADGVGVDDGDKGAAAHPGGGQGRFAAGMAGADHGNIILIHGGGHYILWTGNQGPIACCTGRKCGRTACAPSARRPASTARRRCRARAGRPACR